MGMKVGLLGRKLGRLEGLLEAKGFEICDCAKADVIMTHGGDGALLGAEREFPGVPKFPTRDSATAPLCQKHGLESQVELFAADGLGRVSLPKLQSEANGKSILGINDVFIHSRNPVSALRYKVWIDDELYAEEIVGDGAGVSTVHGATAYYRSITHSIFRVGIGLAFSNSTELVNHLVLPDSAIVKMQITRGPAGLVADNSPDSISLKEGDTATVRKTAQCATVLGLDIFMCAECRRLRHLRREGRGKGAS